MPPALPSPADVVAFWTAAGPRNWFRKDDGFDRDFRERFLPAHEAAARGELDGWAMTSEGALALLVLLDQFPRNAFRGTPRVFATDGRARAVARQAIAAGLDRQQPDTGLRNFFYLPLMHSEDLADQDRALELCAQLGTDAAHHASVHRDIIERFGRFPHRNAWLGRATTAEEQAFLDSGGFAG
ncbi:MAG TPA: DUF924 family protein [Ramlibacter sp.]|nr:DUF924 family protein [Ramlibacter sp.]